MLLFASVIGYFVIVSASLPGLMALFAILLTLLLTAIMLWTRLGRVGIAGYLGWLYKGETAARLSTAAVHEHLFVLRCLAVRRKPADSWLGVSLRTLGSVAALLGIVRLATQAEFPLYSLSFETPLKRLELGAICNTAIIVLATHLSVKGPTQRSMKTLSVVVVCLAFAIYQAVAALSQQSTDSGFMHIVCLVFIGSLQFVYDFIAWVGTPVRSAVKREHFHLCWIVDLPFAVGIWIVFFYQKSVGVVVGDAAQEGLLAGAILMQCIASTILFVIVKQHVLFGEQESVPGGPLPERREIASAARHGRR